MGWWGRFRVKPKQTPNGYPYIEIVPFRQNLNALIMRLHGKYFSVDIPPFSGPPPSNVNISTNVSQSQAIYFQMILEFQSAMDKKLSSLPEESKEKQWREKVKGSLATTNTVTGLVSTIIKIAKDCGLDLNTLSSLFS